MKNLNHLPMSQLEICKHRDDSWWVSRRPLSYDGRPLPFDRLVFFARTREEAQAWIAANEEEKHCYIRSSN